MALHKPDINMREKPANEQAITRLVRFMKDVNMAAISGLQLDVAYSLKQTGAAKRSFSDLKKLGIITVDDDKKIKWISLHLNFRSLALQILDHRLKQSKKTVHFPIPDLSPLTDSLETIVERMNQLLVQHERLLRQPKNNETRPDADLFKVDDQRLFIAGQIAAGLYKGITLCNHELIAVNDDEDWRNPTSRHRGGPPWKQQKAVCRKCGHTPNVKPSSDVDYTYINEIVVVATDDLMKRLLNRNDFTSLIHHPDKVIVKPHVCFGVCKVCNCDIHEDEKYQINEQGLFCEKHIKDVAFKTND